MERVEETRLDDWGVARADRVNHDINTSLPGHFDFRGTWHMSISSFLYIYGQEISVRKGTESIGSGPYHLKAGVVTSRLAPIIYRSCCAYSGKYTPRNYS